MAKYEKNPDDEGKYQCPICEYGHGAGNGKSRQSVSKHFNALHAEETVEAPNTSENLDHQPERVDVNEPDFVDSDDEKPNVPDWLTFDMGDELEEVVTVELNPSLNSILKGMAEGAEPPSSPKAMKEFYAQQGKMMRWLFAGLIDPAFSWYGRSMTSDPDFTIKRSSSDWALFEDVSSSWLEYHGIRLPVTPDIIMVGTIASFYIPVLSQIRKKRDPSKLSLFAKWRKRRLMKKKVKEERLRGKINVGVS